MSIRVSGARLWCSALLVLAASSGRADDMAYMITTLCNCTQQFGTVDLTTGAYTLIANISAHLWGLGLPVQRGTTAACAEGTRFGIRHWPDTTAFRPSVNSG
jgi:hypothetical protein